MAVAGAISKCIENHYYRLGGSIRRQTDGGSIGSDLTGETSRVVMNDWDVCFLAKVRRLGLILDMYKRYVDDIMIICPPVTPGWNYSNVSDIMTYKIEETENTDESRSAKVLSDIANSLDPELQFTHDIPENNSDKRMPVLDLKMWTQPTENGDQVCYSYKKPVSSMYTILKKECNLSWS